MQVIPGSQVPGVWPSKGGAGMSSGWACLLDPAKSLLYKKKESPYGALGFFIRI